MSEHDELRLRVITVSTRAALDRLHDDDDADAATVRSRADALLAELERDVRADGHDPALLKQVALARHGLGREA